MFFGQMLKSVSQMLKLNEFMMKLRETYPTLISWIKLATASMGTLSLPASGILAKLKLIRIALNTTF